MGERPRNLGADRAPGALVRELREAAGKTPRCTFATPAGLCFLVNLDEWTLLNSPMLGAIWETFVFAEIRKLNEIDGRPFGLWYYRDLAAERLISSWRPGDAEPGGVQREEHPGTREARNLSQVNAEMEPPGVPGGPANTTCWGVRRPLRRWRPGLPSSGCTTCRAILAGGSPLRM